MDIDFLTHSLYTRLLPESFRWNFGENLYNVYTQTRRKASGARLVPLLLKLLAVRDPREGDLRA